MVICFNFSKLQINVLSIIIVTIIVILSICLIRKIENVFVSGDSKVIEYSKKDNTVYVLEKMNNSNDEMIEELNDLELTWALKIPKIDLVARN